MPKVSRILTLLGYGVLYTLTPISVNMFWFAQIAYSQQAGGAETDTPQEEGINSNSAQPCTTATVEAYVSKLGTSALTDAEFEALVECGTQAVPVLAQVLESDRSDEARASAAYALGQIGSEAQIAVIELMIAADSDEEDLDVRILAAYALGQIRPELQASASAFITALENGSENPDFMYFFGLTAYYAVWEGASQRIVLPRITRLVLRVFPFPVPVVRQQVQSQANSTSPCTTDAAEAYVSKLGSSTLTSSEFEALVECGAQAVPALSQALKNDRIEVRASAVYVLGQIGWEVEAAFLLLATTLEDKDPDIRMLYQFFK